MVRFPSGAVTRLEGIPADHVVSVVAPAVRPLTTRPALAATLAGCTPATRGRSAARIWNDAAAAVLRAGSAPEPVQARDLYDLSATVARAYALAKTPTGRDAAISYAAYRLLVWQASSNANLHAAFALLTNQLRALCYSPDYTARSGGAAALGNRIGLASINGFAHDGANEQLHFADPTFAARNQPLIVGQPGSTVHDPTFWQPLALAQVSPRGSGSVPAQVQSFVGSQWGDVRTFAAKIAVGPPALGDPSGRTYRDAAIAAIRATAEPFARSALDTSPAAWNASLPSLGLKRDVRLDLALNGALNDVAVSVFGAKRAYESPRPISMIRYLAFTGQLPIVPGLTRRVGKQIQVRAQGRWVAGVRWTPPVQTPASPGYPSADAAFASAADTVLTALTGRTYAARAAQASALAGREGVELPQDATAGTRVGRAVGARALARAR
jgi:hypothetical protein